MFVYFPYHLIEKLQIETENFTDNTKLFKHYSPGLR